MNRTPYNFYAQVDNSNIAVDPGYTKSSGPFAAADIFSSTASALKSRGKDGENIGLISESEMILLGKDGDKDGVLGEDDQCPSLEEDRDGFQDNDGCPDFDNDRDGLYDSQDKCPDQAEDFDGFQDKDGCPDFDNDNDGFPDSVDVCPNNPETKNGYKDDDGCPDEMPVGGEEIKTGVTAPVPSVPPQTTGSSAPGDQKKADKPVKKATPPAAADTDKAKAPVKKSE
jgi:hypothetical protein